jgi:hypothetical protein
MLTPAAQFRAVLLLTEHAEVKKCQIQLNQAQTLLKHCLTRVQALLKLSLINVRAAMEMEMEMEMGMEIYVKLPT